MKLESARGGPILGGSSSFCRDSHVPELWGEHVSCSRRGGTGHTSLTSEGPPRVPLKPEWWSEHTRGYLVGAPLFSSHPENKQGFPSSGLSLNRGIGFRAGDPDACHEKAVYTFCPGFEVLIYSLSLSFCTSYHSWGPGSPQSSWWSFIVCSMVSFTHISIQVASQSSAEYPPDVL